MRIFEGLPINQLYVQMIVALRTTGVELSKSGRKIKELAPCLIKIDRPKNAIIAVKGRPYSPAFVVAETLWNLTGDSDDWLCRYNAIYNAYFCAGKLKAGYGNRIFNWDEDTDQFKLVVERLQTEPTTEHASITIFNPSYDLKNPIFVPCITKVKFRIRENRLHMTSFMRAQDVWLGFPYDINLLLTLFQLMAIRLGIEMGDYYHYCDVLRLYDTNYEQADALDSSASDWNNEIELSGQCDFGKFDYYRDLIRDLPTDIIDLIKNEPEYWQNAIKCCSAYQLLHLGQVDGARNIVQTITNCFRDQFDTWANYYHHEAWTCGHKE